MNQRAVAVSRALVTQAGPRRLLPASQWTNLSSGLDHPTPHEALLSIAQRDTEIGDGVDDRGALSDRLIRLDADTRLPVERWR